MAKHNEQNERLKRDYFRYLKEAKRQSEQSIDAVAKALARFEQYGRYRDFKTFHPEQAIAFKRHLAEQVNQRTGAKLSKSTVRATLAALRSFFVWLAGKPGFRSRFEYADADYFNPSERDSQIALSSRPRPVPSIEQIGHALNLMPADTVFQRRDRALFAFMLLSGCRDRAAVSIKLRHVDIAQRVVFQDPREVHTKFGKCITTFFFPVGEEFERCVRSWAAELSTEHLFGPDDPLFPKTAVARSDLGGFQAQGIMRAHWSNADPVRRIFRDAFRRAGLPEFHPHSVRKTLARLGQQICKSPEQYKAWSQNLGHSDVMTTFASYGHVDEHRQGEIIHALGAPATEDETLQDLFHMFLAARKRR